MDPTVAGGERVITGIFVQTKYQRWKLQQFHDLIGFDHKKSGVCRNLCTPTVMDQEGHLRTAAYVFLCTEEYDSNSWTVEQLIETCPDIVHGTRVALTDGFFLPPDKLEALLPAAMRVKCKKHIVSVDCPKHCPKSEQAEMTQIMWDILGAEKSLLRDHAIEQLKIQCPIFFEQYFVPQLRPKLKSICFCEVKDVFTNGTTTNSYTESMNSSMGRWYVSPSDSIVDLISQSLQKDAQNMKEEQDALGVVMLNSIGLPTDSCWGKACRGVFSDFITNKFEGEIKDSHNYHSFVSDNSTHVLQQIPGQAVRIEITVKRSIVTEAERQIIVDINEYGTLQMLHACPCPLHLNEGLPCRHVMAVVSLLTAQLQMTVTFEHIKCFFHKRWQRQVELFSNMRPLIQTESHEETAVISEQEQRTQGGCEFETEVPGAPENSQPNRPQTKKR